LYRTFKVTCLKREKKNKKLFMVFVDPTLSSLCLLAWRDYQKKGKSKAKSLDVCGVRVLGTTWLRTAANVDGLPGMRE